MGARYTILESRIGCEPESRVKKKTDDDMNVCPSPIACSYYCVLSVEGVEEVEGCCLSPVLLYVWPSSPNRSGHDQEPGSVTCSSK